MTVVRRRPGRSRKSCRWTPGRWLGVFAWSLAATSISPFCAAVDAQPRAIDIPAGPLGESIGQLSEQTGVSIGFSGRLPAIRSRPVRKAGSPADALRQMLVGSGLRAIATGPASFRIEAAPAPPPRSPAPATPPAAPRAIEPDIVITALKRLSPLSTLPATVRVLSGDRILSPTVAPGNEVLAREIPSLSISSLGAGRNRLFLRGIGDGPFNGFNQGSVAILLDEARLTFDAPDPDWALVDIDRVEVLEGPQGPLYGTGALGGIAKVETNQPDMARTSAMVSASVASTDDGDLSNGQSAILNLPLVSGRIAVRAVAYRDVQAGWIDNVGGRGDANREALAGGRIAVRWTPGAWSIRLTGALQGRRARDSQYVDGGLGPLERPGRLPEPRDLDARLAILTVTGPIGGLLLTSITSLSGQESDARYDATPLAPLLGTIGTTKVDDNRDYRLFDQEIRVSNLRSGRFDWLAGVSLIGASTDAKIEASDSTSVVPVLTFKRSVTEAAVFAEGSFALNPTLKAGGGARVFWSRVEDEGHEGASDGFSTKGKVRASGSASLAWTPTSRATLFVRAATAFRPGGANFEPDATQASYAADRLASLEFGSRFKLGDSIAIDSTLFGSLWRQVQTDELLANGLIATRNAGDGRNFGMQADLRWSLAERTVVRGGFLLQSARLETSGGEHQVDDPRLPVVPQFAARLRFSRRFRLGSWDSEADVGLQYVGATHLSFDSALDRRTRGHAEFDASLTFTRDGWSAALTGSNLANSSADVFAFGNPFRLRASPQRTPTRPQTVGISISRSF